MTTSKGAIMKHLFLVLLLGGFGVGAVDAQTVDPCRADIDRSGTVDFRDFLFLADSFGKNRCGLYWLGEDIRLTIWDTLIVRDTLVVTETLRDTLVVTETLRDTLVLRETIRDTLYVVLAQPEQPQPPQPQPEPSQPEPSPPPSPPQPQPQPPPQPEPQPVVLSGPCSYLGGSYVVVDTQTHRERKYRSGRWTYNEEFLVGACKLVPPCHTPEGSFKEVNGECVKQPCAEWDPPRVESRSSIPSLTNIRCALPGDPCSAFTYIEVTRIDISYYTFNAYGNLPKASSVRTSDQHPDHWLGCDHEPFRHPPCESVANSFKEVDGECVSKPCEEWDPPHYTTENYGCVLPLSEIKKVPR